MISLNEFLVKGNINNSNNYDVYKLNNGIIGGEYWVKLSDNKTIKEDIKKLTLNNNICTNEQYIELIKKIDKWIDKIIIIRPSKDSKKPVYCNACNTIDDFNSGFSFVDNLKSVKNFNIDYWKNMGWIND